MKPEKTKYSLRDLKGLWPYLKPEAALLGFCLVLMLGSTGVQLARPWILRLIVDDAVPHADYHLMGGGAGAFLGLLLAGIAISWLKTLKMAEIGIRVVNRLKGALFSHVLHLPAGFFHKHNAGWLVSRIESDTEELKHFCSHLTLHMFTDFLTFAGILVTVYLTSPQLAMGVFPVVVVLLVLIFYFFGKIRARFDQARTAYADLTGFVSEHLGAVFLIQLYGREKQVLNALDEKAERRTATEKMASLLSYGFWSLFLFISQGVLLGVLIYFGAHQVMSQKMSLGTLIMLVEFARQMVGPLRSLGENISQLQRSSVSARRVLGLMDLEVEETRNLPEAPAIQKLQFQQVDFAYEEGKPVLRNVSFTLPRGTRMALVGSSGGGKSTTIQLLCRFLNPTGGDLLLNGVNLGNYSLKSWRQKVGLVLQDIHLFPGTVMDNLKAMDPEISDQKVMESARLLGAEDFILKLPEGYQTVLSERGANLSMGQRQLLSFVRAMARDPELLILDEATASMDPKTERYLQNALQILLHGRTAVLIAHRLSTVRHADCILVIEKGEIVERGNHEELVEHKGRYFELVQLQAGKAA